MISIAENLWPSVMFPLYRRKSIWSSLTTILLSLIIFHLAFTLEAVRADEATLPSAQREKVDEAIKITGDFLRSEKGIEWLAQTMKDRKSQLTTIDLVNAILEMTPQKREIWNAANTLKEALAEKSDSIDLGLNKKNATSDNSEENWNSAVSDVENEDDILCLYRKNTNDPKMKKSEDWKKLLNIAPEYTVYSVTDKGSKYMICLKKINITEVATTTLSSILTTTLANTEERFTTTLADTEERFTTTVANRDENENSTMIPMHGRNLKQENNSTGNIDIESNRRQLKHNNTSTDDSEEDCTTEEIEYENKNNTDDHTLNNVTPLYEGKSIHHDSNVNQNIHNNGNRNINHFMEDRDKLLHSRHGMKIHGRNSHGSMKFRQNKRRQKKKHNRNLKSRRTMKTRKSLTTAPIPRKTKSKQKHKFIPVSPNLPVQVSNTIQENVAHKRIMAIPFVLYLRKLQPIETMRLVSDFVTGYSQDVSPCDQIRQKLLFPLQVLNYARDQPPCMFSETFSPQLMVPNSETANVPYKLTGIQDFISQIKTNGNGQQDQLNLYIPQQNLDTLLTPDANTFNKPDLSQINIQIPASNRDEPKFVQNNNDSKQSSSEDTESSDQTDETSEEDEIGLRIFDEDTKNTNQTTESAVKMENVVTESSTTVDINMTESTSTVASEILSKNVTESAE